MGDRPLAFRASGRRTVRKLALVLALAAGSDAIAASANSKGNGNGNGNGNPNGPAVPNMNGHGTPGKVNQVQPIVVPGPALPGAANTPTTAVVIVVSTPVVTPVVVPPPAAAVSPSSPNSAKPGSSQQANVPALSPTTTGNGNVSGSWNGNSLVAVSTPSPPAANAQSSGGAPTVVAASSPADAPSGTASAAGLEKHGKSPNAQGAHGAPGFAQANDAVFATPKGEVMLAAGQSVELVDPATPGLRVEIAAPADKALEIGSILGRSGHNGIYAGLSANRESRGAGRVVLLADGRIVLASGHQDNGNSSGGKAGGSHSAQYTDGPGATGPKGVGEPQSSERGLTRAGSVNQAKATKYDDVAAGERNDRQPQDRGPDGDGAPGLVKVAASENGNGHQVSGSSLNDPSNPDGADIVPQAQDTPAAGGQQRDTAGLASTRSRAAPENNARARTDGAQKFGVCS